MKIAVWKTGHEIADKIGEIIHASNLYGTDLHSTNTVGRADFSQYDAHIAYGILRGTAEVFKRAQSFGQPWFNIDKGYWNPGHYDGYYRVSLRGTQQTTFKGLECALSPSFHSDISSHQMGDRRRKILVCPPTSAVSNFFKANFVIPDDPNILLRPKGCDRPLQDDLDQCRKVVTFSSSVGWEALRQGIEVVSDPTHSIVGAYQKLVDKPLHLDLDERCKLFALMAGLQLRLSEVREGMLWPLLQKLIYSSDMMDVKPLQAMSLRTVFKNAQ